MKIHRSRSAVLVAVLALATLGLSACGGGSKLAQPKPLADLNNPAYEMHVLWHTSAGDGSGKYTGNMRPAVAGGQVYVANRNGQVVALDLSSGKRIWEHDTKEKLVSGPAVVDGMLFVGTRNGDLLALSASNGDQRWSSNLDSEILASVAGADGIVVVRTSDGHVAAFRAANGVNLWTTAGGNRPKLTIRGTSSPVILGDTVYIGLDNGKLMALNLQTGEQIWSQRVALPTGRSELDQIADIDANPLIRDGVIYVASAGDVLAALSLSDGKILWKKPFPTVDNLAIDDNDLYAIDPDGFIVAATRDIGGLLWMQDALKYRHPTSPSVLDGHVLVGGDQGYLHLFSPRTGAVVGRGRPFGDAIRAQPVVVGDKAIVISVSGEVAAVQFVPSGR